MLTFHPDQHQVTRGEGSKFMPLIGASQYRPHILEAASRLLEHQKKPSAGGTEKTSTTTDNQHLLESTNSAKRSDPVAGDTLSRHDESTFRRHTRASLLHRDTQVARTNNVSPKSAPWLPRASEVVPSLVVKAQTLSLKPCDQMQGMLRDGSVSIQSHTLVPFAADNPQSELDAQGKADASKDDRTILDMNHPHIANDTRMTPRTEKAQIETLPASDEFSDLDDEYIDEIMCEAAAALSSTISEPSSSPTSIALVRDPPKDHETQGLAAHSGTTMQPFLRKAYSSYVTASITCPIPRLLSVLRIPTCFRIAEAIRQLRSQNTPQGGFYMLELFAIVVDILPSPGSQTHQLRLADVFFPHRAPYITATYNHGRVPDFLDVSTEIHIRIVRAIVKSTVITRSNARRQLHIPNLPDQSGDRGHVQIEAIFESSWNEIEYVRRVVDSEGVEAEAEMRKRRKVEG